MKPIKVHTKSAGTLSREKQTSEKKITHIFLQDKHLKSTPRIDKPRDVLVLYLYNNSINKMDHLGGFWNLTSLYLQSNEISKIENLQNLKKLRKLYLGHNSISVVENLNNLEHLEELHIEKQNLPEGTSLCFDPRTLSVISKSLHTLNISHNKISTLSGLSLLQNLMCIDASFNELDDEREVGETIQNWYFLKEAVFKGNPFNKSHRYKENIIAKSYYLENLDGKSVSDNTRKFIKRFEEEKSVKGSRPSINLSKVIKDIPKKYPLALQKAVSASILQRSLSKKLSEDLSTFDERNAVYLAWNQLPKRRPYVTKKVATPKAKLNDLKSSVFVKSFSGKI